MYERNRNSLRVPRRRQQRFRRRAAHRKRILIGAAMVLCLLTYAVQALGSSPALISDDISIEPPKTVTSPSVILPDPTAQKTQTSTPAAPAAGVEEWRLVLVNPWNFLPEDYVVSLTQLKNGHSVDERCYPDLQKMMDDCRAAGLKPVICSSYRTQAKQEQLFQHKVDQYLTKGYSDEDARAEAGKSVAVPGTSEHQLGLAVDIVDLSNQNLDENQEKTAVQKWLMENSWKYGFILRYPNDKSDITGIKYEPWHYRYVGKDAAREIYAQEICLEEYLAQREAGASFPS